ncbi:MAG: hypothetical protein PVJ33_01945 [Lysobacterales bacterium]
MKKPKSYAIMTLLAAVVAYYAWNLSASGRTTIDWIVLILIGSVILWNLFGLGRRLHAIGGGKSIWHIMRTLLFWTVGLYNTDLAAPGEPRGWPFYIGCALVALAALDSIALWRLEQSSLSAEAPEKQGQ